MLVDKGPNTTQQLSQLLKPLLGTLVYANELTLAERELVDIGKRAIVVISVINVWGLGEI